MTAPNRSILISLLFLILGNELIVAQHPYRTPKGSNEIQYRIDRLTRTGKVLYLAAHPDDENTQVISHLSRNELARTAYLSLTRGGGGQNLLGSEQGELLSVLRTQELLEARKIDGGNQFFSRARDFGYSKTAKETFEKWGRDQILEDVIRVIRSYRPDVIITRFPIEDYGGHGHHTASAILAKEAFDKAADPEVFPDQVEEFGTWEVKRLLYNASTWWNKELPDIVDDEPDLFREDVGEYDPYTGLSFTEIAARARSMHKCQGFGVVAERGREWEYFRVVEDRTEEEGTISSIMEGIPRDPKSLDGGAEYMDHVGEVRERFDPARPEKSVPLLVEAFESLEKLEDPHWRKTLRKELKELILACSGTYLEATTDQNSACPGDRVDVRFELTHRSSTPLKLQKIRIGKYDTAWKVTAEQNEPLEKEFNVRIPQDARMSTPHWLVEEAVGGSYGFPEKASTPIVRPTAASEPQVEVRSMIEESELSVRIPIELKERSRVEGEVYEPLHIASPISASSDGNAVIFPDESPKEVEIRYKAHRAAEGVKASLELPDGWKSEPAEETLNFDSRGESERVRFTVHPPKNAAEGKLVPYAELDGERYRMREDRIAYDHITDQLVFRRSGTEAVQLDIGEREGLIGYIMGSGDRIPDALEQMGYRVELIPAHELESEKLDRYDAIVTGVRAFNVNESLRYHNQKLFDYVKNGGHMVVQYNKDEDALVTEEIAPYPLHPSHDRVTSENADAELLDPDHSVFKRPNRITEADFQGWVQERGLYFPDEWDERYTPLISWNDPDEDPKKGALLVTEHGKGSFIYTGISFFRQLPAGVPGAYRLFDNLISYGIGTGAEER